MVSLNDALVVLMLRKVLGCKETTAKLFRRRMEEEIGKIASDTRADKARERQDHNMAHQVQQEEQDEEREGDLRKEEIAEPNEDMDDGIVEKVVQDVTFIDAPASRSDIRIKSPDRKKAAKRGTDRHDEEPSTKRIVFEDARMEEDDGIVVASLAAKREDQLILYHAVLGHDLNETCSNKSLKLAGTRFVAGQLMRVDMNEMFSPERVTAVCKQYGLVPGQAMDIKNVFYV